MSNKAILFTEKNMKQKRVSYTILSRLLFLLVCAINMPQSSLGMQQPASPQERISQAKTQAEMLRRVQEVIPQNARQRFPTPGQTPPGTPPAVPPRRIIPAPDDQETERLRQEVATKQRELVDLERQNKLADNTIEDLQKIISNDEKRLKDLQDQLLKAAAQGGVNVSDLQKTIQSQEKSISGLKAQLEEQVANLKQQDQQQQEARKQLQLAQENLQKQVESLQKTLQATLLTNENLNAEKKALEAKLAQKEQQLSSSQVAGNANKELRQRLLDAQQAEQARLKEINDQKSAYDAQIASLQQQLSVAQKPQPDVQQAANLARKEAEEARQQLKAAQDHAADLNRQLEALKARPASPRAEAAPDVSARLKELEEEAENRQKINEGLVETIQDQLDAIQKQKKQINELQQQLKKAQE